MNLLLVFSGTTTISLFIEAINETKMLKIYADKGYKIEHHRIVDVANSIDTKFNIIKTMIPFYNILNSLKRYSEMLKIKDMTNEQIKLIEHIIPMTDDELDNYTFKNNIIDVLDINLKKQNNIDADSLLIYMEDGVENEILFNQKNNNIIKTTGNISSLNDYIKQKKLEEQLSFFKEKEIEEKYEPSKKEQLNNLKIVLIGQQEKDQIKQKVKVS